MKNIHVLPTDKPSRFYFNNNDKCFQLCKVDKKSTPLKINQNIHITSDEEIKEGDYYIDFTSDGLKIEHFKTKDDWVLVGICDSKKIILTTDQDLNKDGVQAIDDEFLEWFVKNPSCEEVEVIKEKYSERFDNDKSPIGNPNTWGNRYVIITPKEEPKQEQNKNKYSEEEVIDSIQYTIDNFFNGKLAGLNSKEILEQFKNK